MVERKITILGGDKRSVILADLLAQDGNKVIIYGFDDLTLDFKGMEEKTLNNSIKNSDIIIGPLPFANGKKQLNTPLFSQEIFINKLFEKITKNQILMGGKIESAIWDLAEKYNILMVDYFKREEMQILNGIPTAEGAIQIAMEEMPITIHGSNSLVLGFGRIGKILSKMIDGIGSNVYVGARNYADIAWAKSYGYNSVHIKEIERYLPQMDVIFNTIPTIILDEFMLKKINTESIIIDLASKPGGLDFNKAEEMNIKTIWALALPGKVAPITAALCIKETIYNIIKELEE